MDDFIIQVKSGRANGLFNQINQTQLSTTKMVVGYAPDNFSNLAWENAAKNGVPIARNFEELLQIINEHSN